MIKTHDKQTIFTSKITRQKANFYRRGLSKFNELHSTLQKNVTLSELKSAIRANIINPTEKYLIWRKIYFGSGQFFLIKQHFIEKL
jgi:hypothetical protein